MLCHRFFFGWVFRLGTATQHLDGLTRFHPARLSMATLITSRRVVGRRKVDARYITRVFELFSTGNYTRRQIASYLREMGVKGVRG